MTRSFLSLLAVCACFFTFTACLEESAESLLLVSESGLTQGEVDDEHALSDMTHAYYHGNVGGGGSEDEMTTHQLSFTAEDVYHEGRLSGTTDMMIVMVSGYGSDPAGKYKINGNTATATEGFAYTNYCYRMNFDTGTAADDVPMNDGTLTITANEDGSYKVAYTGTIGNNVELAGTFNTPLTPVE